MLENGCNLVENLRKRLAAFDTLDFSYVCFRVDTVRYDRLYPAATVNVKQEFPGAIIGPSLLLSVGHNHDVEK